MTAAVPNPDRMVHELLAAAKSKPFSLSEATDASDYDWQSPCSFTSVQLQSLDRFAARVAEEISAALSRQLSDEVRFEPGRIRQYYAAQLSTIAGEAAKYYVPLVAKGGRACGFVVVPGDSARRWVVKALGSSTEVADKELSSLESALLVDIISDAAAVVDQLLRQAGGAAIDCGKEISTDLPMADDDPSGIYTELPVKVADEGDQPSFSIVLDSDSIAPAARAKASRPTKAPEQIRQDILAVIKQVRLTGEAWIGTAELPMREIMQLAEGDVLLVRRKVGEPIELTANGKTVLVGHPVRCQGRYALQVIGWVGDEMP